MEIRPAVEGKCVLGNENQISCTGKCVGVTVRVQGLDISGYIFLPMELGILDLILGAKWLRTLRNSVVNWDKMLMKIRQKRKKQTIRGDPKLTDTLVNAQTQ